MKKDYLPLKIASHMANLREKTAIKYNKEIEDLTFNKIDKKGSPLNLDEFIAWVIGPSFCKRSYQGKFEDFNNHLLFIYEQKYQKRGKRYQECVKEFRNCIISDTLFTCWNQEKQVYQFDPDFAKELINTSVVKVPIRVLSYLPVRCFYLDLTALPFESIAGVFVYVTMDETDMINFACSRVRERTDEEEFEFDCLHISAKELIKAGMLKKGETSYLEFSYAAVKEICRSNKNFDKAYYKLLVFILQAALYLSSAKPDVLEKKEHSKKQKMHQTEQKKLASDKEEAKITEVGVRYGAVIRKTKKETNHQTVTITSAKEAAKARKPMVSHIRCAHWHHYWVGPGRKEQIVKWVPPTFVSGYGKELPITIHKVKGETKNG